MSIFGVSSLHDLISIGSVIFFGIAANLLFKKLYEKTGLLDLPSKSILKIQKKPIPLSGGMAVFTTFACFLTLALVTTDCLDRTLAVKLLVMLFLVMAAGVADDKMRIAASIRLIFYISFAVLISLIFSQSLDIGIITLTVTALLLAPGIATAINMIDGMDGICASLSLTSLVGFLLLGLTQGNSWGLIYFSLAGLLSLVPFIIFNFNPAKIFLGSSGSEFIGFLFVVLVMFSMDGQPLYLLPLRILLIGIPILDMMKVMFTRLLNKKPLMAGDRNHIYDIFFRKLGSQRKVWAVMVLAQVAIVSTILYLNTIFI